MIERAKLPTNLHWQCPLCGVPVDTVRVGILAHSGEKALDFECCGNAVTFTAMRDAFGIDLGEYA